MKRLTLVLGLLGVLLATAFAQGNLLQANISITDARLDEGAQLGSAYPEITQWAVSPIDEGAQLGSAYPEIAQWPDPLIVASTSKRTKVKKVAMKQ